MLAGSGCRPDNKVGTRSRGRGSAEERYRIESILRSALFRASTHRSAHRFKKILDAGEFDLYVLSENNSSLGAHFWLSGVHASLGDGGVSGLNSHRGDQ